MGYMETYPYPTDKCLTRIWNLNFFSDFQDVPNKNPMGELNNLIKGSQCFMPKKYQDMQARETKRGCF